MVTALDNEIGPEVLNVIAEVGTSATFTVVTAGGEYDPETRETSAPTTSEVVEKVSPPFEYEQRHIDGENIKSGDANIILPGSGLTFTPAIGMLVSVAGKSWRIVRPDPIYSGDLIAAWSLQLRR